MRKIALRSVMAVLVAVLFFPTVAGAEALRNPSVLILCPRGPGSPHFGWADLTFLRELHQKGLEVDYTTSDSEVTWERIKDYTCLVLYYRPPDPELIERYLAEGGGVFMMAHIFNNRTQPEKDMLEHWGAKIPLEQIKDDQNVACMTHMPGCVKLAYTANVLPSPVSEGVRGIWYPYGRHYNAGNTNPLALSDDWQVVIRASRTSFTEPIDVSDVAFPDRDALHDGRRAEFRALRVV